VPLCDYIWVKARECVWYTYIALRMYAYVYVCHAAAEKKDREVSETPVAVASEIREDEFDGFGRVKKKKNEKKNGREVEGISMCRVVEGV
jgi:hypothetical protein